MSRMNKSYRLIMIFFFFFLCAGEWKRDWKLEHLKGYFSTASTGGRSPPQTTHGAGFVINMLKMFRFVRSKRKITPIYKPFNSCAAFLTDRLRDHLAMETPLKTSISMQIRNICKLNFRACCMILCCLLALLDTCIDRMATQDSHYTHPCMWRWEKSHFRMNKL